MTERIPRQFHFIFGLKKQDRPFHLFYYLNLESCFQVNHPERVYFYYHNEPYGRYWDLIRERLTMVRVDPNEFVSRYVYANAFIRQYSYAHHSDFIRLEQLLPRGGIYADIDTLFVNPYPAEFYNEPCVMGREPDVVCQATGVLRPSLCNALIFTEPNGAFVRTWMEQQQAEFDGSWTRHSTFLPYDLSRQYPSLLRVEPIRSFFHHGTTPKELATLFQGCDRNFDRIYSMHLWSHLWWSRWRRDFSSFHAGRITEDHIRRVDTTYNIVARKYLPPVRKSFFLSRFRQAITRAQGRPASS